MRLNAFVVGAGMTRFGKHLDRGLKSLGAEAIQAALDDAGLTAGDLEVAYMGTAASPVTTGQVMIAGEVVLRGMGIGRLPVINVENACATSATAFQQAATMITCGAYDVALVAGYEKLYHEDKRRAFQVFGGALDVEAMEQARSGAGRGSPLDAAGVGEDRSIFMDVYAASTRRHMQAYGSTLRHFAAIVEKNSVHGSMNPRAQFQTALTIDEILAARVVAAPLTLPMCSPIGDGAAALILVSERRARQLGSQVNVRVRASALASGWDYEPESGESVPRYAAGVAYETADVGPADLDVVELHDATASAELMCYEHLGLAPPGEGTRLVDEGATRLGGRIPVNTSGGLIRKGHPIGASGAAQIVELVEQLRGRAGRRQVEGARLAMAENGGGAIGSDVAAVVVSILEKVR
jgi:acetyl-CoA acetyltransferase